MLPGPGRQLALVTGEGLDRLAGKGCGHCLAVTTELISGERISGVIS